MDIDESITVTKIHTEKEKYYLLVGWQPKSFEMYLYTKGQIWKGRFTSKRLTGFSRNLHRPEDEYYENTKRCLSEQREEYQYELRSGFFYWKKLYRGSIIIEGFLPLELDESQVRPDLLEILLIINKLLKRTITDLNRKHKALKEDYFKCIKDTEEFFNLKSEMDKSLYEKFLHLLSLKKSEVVPKIRNYNSSNEKNLLS
jgi:hypothetical protein